MRSKDVDQQEARNESGKRPPFVIHETPTEYQIAFNLARTDETQLHVYVSQDEKRLHVSGRKDLHDAITKFLLVFEMPLDVEPRAITVDRNADVYLIGLPKRKFWPRIKQKLEQMFAGARETSPLSIRFASFRSRLGNAESADASAAGDAAFEFYAHA